jgi:hypothetical protein
MFLQNIYYNYRQIRLLFNLISFENKLTRTIIDRMFDTFSLDIKTYLGQLCSAQEKQLKKVHSER